MPSVDTVDFDDDGSVFEAHVTPIDNNDNASNKHWMPDKLCKNCYTCDQPFTMFRRRHHCRLCGQIFCGGCCGNFVAVGREEKERHCGECFEEIGRKSGGGGSGGSKQAKREKDLVKRASKAAGGIKRAINAVDVAAGERGGAAGSGSLSR